MNKNEVLTDEEVSDLIEQGDTQGLADEEVIRNAESRILAKLSAGVELPPLPEPDEQCDGPYHECDMERYAKEAIAADRARLAGQEAVAHIPLTCSRSNRSDCALFGESNRPSKEWYAAKIKETDGLDDTLPCGALATPVPAQAEKTIVFDNPSYPAWQEAQAEKVEPVKPVCALGCWRECQHKGALGCRENTTPPAQPAREWVGLTDGLYEEAAQATHVDSFLSGARWAEAKLREKNAGQPAKTMNDKYGDGSDHAACPTCGLCISCGDCAEFGCLSNAGQPVVKEN